MPTTRRTTQGEQKAAPAKAAAKATRSPARLTAAEVEARLAGLDAAWATAPANRFAAEIAQGPSGVRPLLVALSDKNPQARADAALALAEVGAKSKDAVQKLKAALDDPSAPVRSAAAVALIRMGDKALLEEVIKGLSDGSPRTIAGAASAAGLARAKEAVPYLLAAFRTTDREVGAAVARALGQIGDPRAVEWLLAALKAGFVPAEACEALGRIGDGAAVPMLVKALGHPDPDVRANAARALGLTLVKGARKFDIKMREQKVLPGLRKAMEDPSKKVRLCAALSLHELGERGAADRLAAVLHSL